MVTVAASQLWRRRLRLRPSNNAWMRCDSIGRRVKNSNSRCTVAHLLKVVVCAGFLVGVWGFEINSPNCLVFYVYIFIVYVYVVVVCIN